MCVCLISNTSRREQRTHTDPPYRVHRRTSREVYTRPGALTPHTRHGTHGGGDLADFSRESDLVASRTCGDGGLCGDLARAYGRGVGYDRRYAHGYIRRPCLIGLVALDEPDADADTA